MYRYVFLFWFNDVEVLKNDLVDYLYKKDIVDQKSSYILSQKTIIKKSDNIIIFDKLNTVEIKIYSKYKIFAVFTNRIRDIKGYGFLLDYVPVNLVDNKFVVNLFKRGFSNNLTNISLEVNESYGEETLNLMGNKLFNIDIFEEMEVFNEDSVWKINEYAFQPYLSKYCIKIREPNRIEFNKRILDINRENIIKEIISIVVRG